MEPERRQAAGHDRGGEVAYAQVPLRHYRLFSRTPYVDVWSSQLVLHLPSIFGGRHNFVVPTREVAVADPSMSVGSYAGPDIVYVPPLRLPYLATTTSNVNPNVVLFFATPQRVPPVRFGGAMTTGLGRRASRSASGLLVDGVRLRAVDAGAAVNMIASAGVARIGDGDAWFSERRQTTTDPEAFAQVKSITRRSRVSGGAVLVGAALLGIARGLLDHAPAWLPAVFGGVGLIVAFGVPSLIRRRNRAAQQQLAANAARGVPR